ncbi:MAG TPA: hypothetical protein VM491_05830 [Burkholderiaceae bacterium]|jgi:hypothetical protein|nr:hypothetical protein [Burkholderiaceae bacterium]
MIALQNRPAHGARTPQRDAAAASRLQGPRYAPPRPPLTQTALRFPWVVQKIQRAWESPRAFDAVMDDLLIDQRGGRRGFPFEVLTELVDLRAWYDAWLKPQGKRGL